MWKLNNPGGDPRGAIGWIGHRMRDTRTIPVPSVDCRDLWLVEMGEFTMVAALARCAGKA